MRIVVLIGTLLLLAATPAQGEVRELVVPGLWGTAAMAVGPEHEVWVAQADPPRLSRYDGARRTGPPHLLPSGTITATSTLAAGRDAVFIGGGGSITRWTPSSGALKTWTFPASFAPSTALLVARDGSVWGRTVGTLLHLVGDTLSAAPVGASGTTFPPAEAADGRIWLSSGYGKLTVVTPSGGASTLTLPRPSFIAGPALRIGRTMLFAGTDHSLIAVKGDRVIHERDDLSITGLARGRDGRVYATTAGGALVSVDSRLRTKVLARAPRGRALRRPHDTALVQGRGGALYALGGGGLVRFSHKITPHRPGTRCVTPAAAQSIIAGAGRLIYAVERITDPPDTTETTYYGCARPSQAPVALAHGNAIPLDGGVNLGSWRLAGTFAAATQDNVASHYGDGTRVIRVLDLTGGRGGYTVDAGELTSGFSGGAESLARFALGPTGATLVLLNLPYPSTAQVLRLATAAGTREVARGAGLGGLALTADTASWTVDGQARSAPIRP